MANNVDPGSTLFAYGILSDALVFEFLGHYRKSKQMKTTSWSTAGQVKEVVSGTYLLG